ncbi:MAG TPA: hypothetical protein VFX98_05750 [Longimicrobiaceae bacterium]|nr:hypothetical protein [Longimicrobiaceae bacterium]
MAELKKTTQTGQGNLTTGRTLEGEEEQGEAFGAAERAERGTDRDLDRTGESRNQAHGHPRGERKTSGG